MSFVKETLAGMLNHEIARALDRLRPRRTNRRHSPLEAELALRRKRKRSSDDC
jgi:hypothetical protein